MKHINYIYLAVMMVVVLGAMFLWLTQTAEAPMIDEVMCTQEAMECPDGSYVGRQGPNCEFAECPSVLETAESNQMIQVATPQPGDTVSSPLQLTGQATGPWFFEASAPVVVEDANGNVLGQSFVTAQGNWMTTNFVSFTGTINFTVPTGITNGFVIFKKDNPSGEPQFDDELAVPVQFAP